ncbi:unnamed protein product [Phytophthora lilii]|uniref:Unnamed protein product n=1 Tax=Phytophthora lilii TaxID=2077276 RepID=A0A9W7DDG3_9STRA|nr:unnamed protein product [Phytophthora lilii]
MAACSSWSSLYVDNLEGVCVCNETHCDSVSNEYLSLTAGQVGVFTTSQAGARLEYNEIRIDGSPVSSPTFSVDASTQYQSIIGFGGAFTDSTAINIYKLSPKLQNLLLDQYFSEKGIQYTLGRVSIGSNDFSTSIYSYNDVEGDLAMENFSIDVDKLPNSHKIELIHRVLNMTSRDIKLFAGEPGDEYWKALALYYSRFIDAYKKEGINCGRDIIGDLNSYASGWTDWNMALDTEGEPDWAKNHVDSPILVDAENGAEFYKQPMFYFMGHFSKFVPAGSRRVKLSVSDDADSELQSCAFVTPEKQVVIQFLNFELSEEVVSVEQSDSSTFTVVVPAHSMVTAIVPAA